MKRLIAKALALVLAAAPLSAEEGRAQEDAAAREATPEAGDEPAAPKDEIEFVEGGAPAAPLPLPLPVPAPEAEDTTPPRIEDLAVAAANPDTAPLLTAVFTDDYSGVAEAVVRFRAPGEAAYRSVSFEAGSGGLFLARLPDGLQRTGFEYYVEVFDAAKNGPAQLGSAEAPLQVAAAKEGTLARLAREEREDVAGAVHPGWVMLAMGTGLATGAASGFFWYDLLAVVQPNLEKVNQELDGGSLTPARAAELEAQRAALEGSSTGNAIVGAILGVVAAAALTTGVALLVVSAASE